MLFDTHTHIDQSEFDASRSAVLQRAQAAGVTQIIAVGCTAKASQKCVEIAHQHEGLYAAVGIQPNYVAEAKVDGTRRAETLDLQEWACLYRVWTDLGTSIDSAIH